MITISDLTDLAVELRKHMFMSKDSLSRDLWEIDFHENGTVSFEDEGLVLSGDNGLMVLNEKELPSYLDVNLDNLYEREADHKIRLTNLIDQRDENLKRLEGLLTNTLGTITSIEDLQGDADYRTRDTLRKYGIDTDDLNNLINALNELNQ